MCLQTDPKARKPASELKTTAFIDKPIGYAAFADFLQLNAESSFYNKGFDDKGLPKSLMQQENTAPSEDWNFTADSVAKEEIAAIAEQVVSKQTQRDPDTPDMPLPSNKAQIAGSPEPTSKPAKNKKKSKDCIIS